MFKNVCKWSKRIHEPIFEVAGWDHVVYIEICASNIIRKTVRVLVVIWKDNELFAETFLKHLGRQHWSRYCPKSTEFASRVHSSIMSSRKRMNCYWSNVFRPKNSGSILVYNARCQCIPWTFLVHVELREVFDPISTILYVSSWMCFCDRINKLDLALVEHRDQVVTLTHCMQWRMN